MLVQMLGVFEFEREMIIDRVINGMERKASKGKMPTKHSLTLPHSTWPNKS
jgi:DNA invertase Pin-like site-specific DNA recombinase